jgi:hypothetical protein
MEISERLFFLGSATKLREIKSVFAGSAQAGTAAGLSKPQFSDGLLGPEGQPWRFLWGLMLYLAGIYPKNQNGEPAMREFGV